MLRAGREEQSVPLSLPRRSPRRVQQPARGRAQEQRPGVRPTDPPFIPPSNSLRRCAPCEAAAPCANTHGSTIACYLFTAPRALFGGAGSPAATGRRRRCLSAHAIGPTCVSVVSSDSSPYFASVFHLRAAAFELSQRASGARRACARGVLQTSSSCRREGAPEGGACTHTTTRLTCSGPAACSATHSRRQPANSKQATNIDLRQPRARRAASAAS
jgi:hypothetical protein